MNVVGRLVGNDVGIGFASGTKLQHSKYPPPNVGQHRPVCPVALHTLWRWHHPSPFSPPSGDGCGLLATGLGVGLGVRFGVGLYPLWGPFTMVVKQQRKIAHSWIPE